MHKSQQSLQPKPVSSAKQTPKLFTITAKQRAAAAALEVLATPLAGSTKETSQTQRGRSLDVQGQVTSTSAHLFLIVSEEALKNSKQGDIAQDQHLQFAFCMKLGSWSPQKNK